MNYMGLLIAAGAFSAVTVGGFMASSWGWGLPTGIDQPVSVRADSASNKRHGRRYSYFGHRRHHRSGGFRGGK